MPYAKCNDINLYYEIHGDGEPLILINGLGGTLKSLLALTQHLKKRFSVISFDLRGAGRSDKPKEPYSISQMAGDVEALFKVLGIDRSHVMGFSMGGCIALNLAINRPELMKSIVLVSTIPAWQGPYPVSKEIRTLFRRTDISRGLLMEVYEKIFGRKFKEKISFDEYFKARMIDQDPQPEYAYINQVIALEHFDMLDQLMRVSLPTTIVVGDSDEVAPMENSLLIHRSIGGSKLFILEGIGHTITMESPKELAEIIIDNAGVSH